MYKYFKIGLSLVIEVWCKEKPTHPVFAGLAQSKWYSAAMEANIVDIECAIVPVSVRFINDSYNAVAFELNAAEFPVFMQEMDKIKAGKTIIHIADLLD